MSKIRIGGADTFALRGTTLVENYVPGPMRQNLLQDPTNRIGKIDFGTFGNDENLNGPGTILQALPDATRYQYDYIFMPPRPTINKEVGIDDRQIASYQVEQLHNNPLSIYTIKPDSEIPNFFCDSEPNNYSTMINKRESDVEKWFIDVPKNNYVESKNNNYVQSVYEQYTGDYINPNLSVVYNMNLNTKDNYNPFISQGSSDVATSKPDFSGKCYSGVPTFGTIYTNSGSNPPNIYGPNEQEIRTRSDIGFMNKQNNDYYCKPKKEVKFANPLVI